MQRTEQTTVLPLQQSRSALPRLSRPDFLHCGINFNKYNAVTVGNSGAIWTGAGSLTISRSRRPFRTAYLRFILIEHRDSLHSDRYAHAATHEPVLRLFAGSEHSMCKDAQSSIADIIYDSQIEQVGLWWVTEQNKDKVKRGCDVLEARSTCLSFFLFLYYAYPIILNDRLCRMYLFFSAALFTVLTARC